MNKPKKEEKVQVWSEAEVLERLDIPNFRHMTKDKVMAFCSMIPDMDADVAKAALGQFPNFVQMATEVVSCYKEQIGSVLKENAISTKDFNASCDVIIDFT